MVARARPWLRLWSSLAMLAVEGKRAHAGPTREGLERLGLCLQRTAFLFSKTGLSGFEHKACRVAGAVRGQNEALQIVNDANPRKPASSASARAL